MTASQRLTAGTLLGGRYRLVGPLPGAGRNWSVHDEVDGRELLARLVVLPDTMPAAERDAARQRALHDAATLSRVRSQAVAYVVDTVVEDGVPWVVSVRPAGRSLGEILRTGGPVPTELAARVGLQALDALGAARVPHGDLTPDDVLVSVDGRVAVVGFGTTPVDGTETPGFRAPEGGPSAAADLWALGVILYAAVEGRLPDGPGGGPLRPVLDRLLAVEPGRRSGGDDVRALLARVGRPPPVGAPRLNDPDVAAALAAFDAALPRSESSDRTAPVDLSVPAARTPVGNDAPRPETPDAPPPAPATRAAEARGTTPAAARRPAAGPAGDPRRTAAAGDRPPTDPPAVRDQAPSAVRDQAPTEPSAVRDRPPAELPAVGARTTEPPATTGRERRAPLTTGTRRAVARRKRRRWSWAAVAAVVVLVAAAVALPSVLRRDDRATPPAAAPSRPVGSATPGPEGAVPPPSGFRLYRDPAGWSIGIPAGWTTGRAGAAVTFHDGPRVLSVVARDDAPPDPYRQQLAQAPDLAKDTDGYDFQRIARVDYRGWPTSDWEYRSGGRPELHTLARTTVPTGRSAYEFTWTTLDRSWTADKRYFDTAARTFDPGA